MAYSSLVGEAKSTWQPEPWTKGKLVVYDNRLFKRQNAELKDWTKNRKDWQSTYANWLSDFNKSTPEYGANIAGEKDFLHFIRDGGLSAQNSALRNAEHAADVTGQKNALDWAGNSASFARLAAGGNPAGTSSADYARRVATGQRIADSFAGRDVARQRADLATENNLKLGTAGQLNALVDKLNNRQLMPHQLQNDELDHLINQLSALGQQTQYGADKVFWNENNDFDRVGGTIALAGDAYSSGSSYGQNVPASPNQPGASPQVQQIQERYNRNPNANPYSTNGYDPATPTYDYGNNPFSDPYSGGGWQDSAPAWMDYGGGGGGGGGIDVSAYA